MVKRLGLWKRSLPTAAGLGNQRTSIVSILRVCEARYAAALTQTGTPLDRPQANPWLPWRGWLTRRLKDGTLLSFVLAMLAVLFSWAALGALLVGLGMLVLGWAKPVPWRP